MPTISPLPFDVKAIGLSAERNAKRSPGVHLTSITKDMMVTAGIKRKYRTPLTDDQQHLVFENGFLWENAVAEYIQTPENQQIEIDNWISKYGLEEQRRKELEEASGAIIRPGECSLDGIYMTPDAINVKLFYIHEWKATSIRVKNFSIPTRRVDWIWQVGAYCKVFGMTRGIIRVWHSADFPQQVTQWVLDYTQKEIDDNWNAIKTHLRIMQERRYEQTV